MMMSLQTEPTRSTRQATAIACRELVKSIDERLILHDINVDIPAGAFVAILGANGAGKSTLLKILATLMPPTSGSLELFGHDATKPSSRIRAQIGLIGHQSMLYRDLSARENLEFFARLYNCPDPHARAHKLLESVALADRSEDAVKAFSRGMTQRLAIARALVHEPELLLADEPFEGLDAPSSRSLEDMLAHLHQSGKTVVLVNHDIEQSLRLAHRAIVLRLGRIVIDDVCNHLSAEAVLKEMSRS